MNINEEPHGPNTQKHTAEPTAYAKATPKIAKKKAYLPPVETGDTVRHIIYTQPTHGKRKKRSALLLTLALFLCFALSLLAVYFIATKYRDAHYPDLSSDTQKDTAVSGSAENAIGAGSESDGGTETAQDTEAETDASVYASVTPDTAVIAEEAIGSKNAILLSLSDFTVLAERNGDARIFPASMTKIMTLLVAVEHVTDLSATAVMTKETANYCYTEGASVAGFAVGEEITVRDLLYGTILPSGADATRTLAEFVAGSEEAFAVLMNEKVAQLGLTGTHFVNSSGLHDDNHYSTVHDIALILRAALENDTCFKILSAPKYVTSETKEHPNGIPLSSIVHSRTSGTEIRGITVVAGKTGSTPEAGQCLATYAITDYGKEYILVTSAAESRDIPVHDAKILYEQYVTDTGNPTGGTDAVTDIAA